MKKSKNPAGDFWTRLQAPMPIREPVVYPAERPKKPKRPRGEERPFTVLDRTFPNGPGYHFDEKVEREDQRWVYALVDPRDSTVRYVGMSRRPRERLEEHCDEPVNYKAAPWIADLAAAGLRPQMVALCCVHWKFWENAERRWIGYYRRLGRLYNIAPGGKYTPRRSVKKGRRERSGRRGGE